MKTPVTIETRVAFPMSHATSLQIALREICVALTALFALIFVAPDAFASQLVLNSTGGTATLGTDFTLTNSTVTSPAGTLSLDCPITSFGGGTTLDYHCTGGSFTYVSTDGTTTVTGAFGVANLYLSVSGGGKGGNLHYYYGFYGAFSGTQTVNGVSAAITGETNAAIGPLNTAIGSGSATACCGATGINSAYTPLYVTDNANSQLVRSDDLWGTNKQVFGTTGTRTNQFSGPRGVAVDISGRIYVVDSSNCRIVRVDNMTGANWTTLGGGRCGAGTKQFSGPTDIALDATGRIYVADTNNSRIIRFDDMLGTNWKSFGTLGSGTNQLSGAQGVAVDAAGKIYIADTGNLRIVRVDDMVGTNWTTLTQSPVINGYIFLFGSPAHVAIDPSGRIVIGDNANIIRVDDMTGTNWAEIGVGTTVQGLSVDPGGTTFIAGTIYSGTTGEAMLDDVKTGAGFNTSNFVAQTGGIYPIPVPAPVAAVKVAPSSLAFSSQNTGTGSAPQNIVVTNFGSLPLDISNIGITSGFLQSSGCSNSLPGGSNCPIAVTFAPVATGTQSGTLTIADNAFTGTQTVALTGTGTAPVAGVSPASLAFQSQLINTTSGGQLVFLSNTGTGPLTFLGSGIAVSGDFAQTNNCGGSLAPATSCGITVTFTPTVTGSDAGTLTVNSNGAALIVSLMGTGASTAPSVTATPESLDFSTQLIKTKSPAQTVTFTNSGTTSVTLTSTTVSGDFAKIGSCAPSLGAGKSCTLSVTFTPTVAGTRAGALTFTLSSGSVTVALTGTGVSTATGWLNFSPPSVSFVGYVVGDNPTQTVTVTNTNGVPTGITRISISGSTTFTQTNNCGTLLPATATCTISVTFVPTVAGTFGGTLQVTESAGTSHKIPLSGTAANDGGGN
jgi:Abnormal spindle-like microcephaly-assoc'd, ASPM-SPD-2-Hydin/NHL repeat